MEVLKHQHPTFKLQRSSKFQLKFGAWYFSECWRLMLGACVVLASFFLFPAVAAPDTEREYRVKAVFLFNFTQFTEWPTEAFGDKDAPIVIGILGTDPFGELLDDTVRGEEIHGRRLEVKRYRSLAEIKSCHILYIGQSEASRLDRILERIKGKPVLTVTDIPDAATRGVMIGFVSERSRVRLRVNPEAAKAANLSLSSKLLRASELVSDR